jgi:hypothetical protein
VNIPPNARFVLTNDNAGDDVTPEVLAAIAAAIDHVLSHDFKDAWGGSYSCIAASGSEPSLPGDVAVTLQTDSTIQGAAGYHDDDGIYCFRDGLPALTQGAFAFSVVISHEIFEAAVDPGANQWADHGDGTEVAKEACDAVESFCFTVPATSVDVSDFLLPSFFDPGGVAPFSKMGNPKAPMTTATNQGTDYQIVRTVDESGAQQVTADLSRHPRRLAKSNPNSRTSRRLARNLPALIEEEGR